MTRSKLALAFYIYSDLYIASFLICIALVELICGFALIYLGIDSIGYIALGSAFLFSLISALMSLQVYASIKKCSLFN
jgi:hypothetical protein